jgi:hypothetical protein
MIRLLTACTLLSFATSCAQPMAAEVGTEVAVIGTIHSGHRNSEVYSLAVLEQMIRDLEPDAVLVEIPPDRLAAAAEQFAATGEITEPRVRVFPEYTDVLFPLQAELGFEIVACAGWTAEMNNERRAKMQVLQAERPDENARINEAQNAAGQAHAELGDPNDPRVIHTVAYDEIVRTGMTPYDELWNDEIGPGGWTNINIAHWSLLESAIDARPGQRLVITFGSWHKYWFNDRLREREDVRLLPVPPPK